MKELEIILKIRDEAAKAVQKASIDGFQKTIDAANKAAEAQEKAAAKAAAARIKAEDKAADAALKAADRAVAAAEKAAERGSVAREKAAQRATAADERASRSSMTADERRATAASRAMERASAASARASQLAGDASKKFIQADGQAAEAHAGAIDGITGAVTKAGLAYLALSAGKKVVTGISDAWAAQRKDVEDSVLRITGYQEKLKELADLKDHIGRTTPEAAAQVRLRFQTTQSAEDARKFSEGMLNAGQVAMKGNLISPEQFEKLTVLGGKAQTVKSIDAETAGNFFGGLPAMFMGKNQQADDVAARGLGIVKILQAGKSSVASGVNQFQAVAALASSGAFGTPDVAPERLAATQSFFSLAKKDAAGEMVQQFVRATTGAIDMTRRGGIEGGEAQGAYLDRIGAKSGMTSTHVAGLIAKDVGEQRKLTPNFDVDSYLKHHGYGNMEDRLTLGTAISGIQNGQFDTFQDMTDPKKRPTIGESMKPIDDSIRVDPTAAARTSDIAKDAADIARGVGAPAMFSEAKKAAFYRLKGQGKTYGQFDESNQSNLYQGMLLDEVQREIYGRAQKVGVDTSKYGDMASEWRRNLDQSMFGVGTGEGLLGGIPLARMMTSEKTRAEAYAELEGKIGAAGGPGIDNTPLIEAMNRNTAVAERIEKAILSGQGKPMPLPAAPPILNAQPAGGMKRGI